MKNSKNDNEKENAQDTCAVKSPQNGQSFKARLSEKLLRQLRNEIPIQYLIENELDIRHHMDGNIFRFECPFCKSYHTGIMKERNLARCFDCENNFNTIDFVVEVRKTSFRPSAEFLINILNEKPYNKPVIRGSSDFVSIGNIISESGLCKSTPQPVKNSDENERLKSLEKDMDELKKRFEMLNKFVITQFGKMR